MCSTNLGFSVGYILCTRYVCMYHTLWYQVRIMYQIRMMPGTYCIAICLFVSGWWYAWYPRSALETAVSLFVYPLVGGGITRTFRPWMHTSDDSYIYQLSLVVATATVSFSVREDQSLYTASQSAPSERNGFFRGRTVASSRIMVPPRAERVWGVVSVARSGPGKYWPSPRPGVDCYNNSRKRTASSSRITVPCTDWAEAAHLFKRKTRVSLPLHINR